VITILTTRSAPTRAARRLTGVLALLWLNLLLQPCAMAQESDHDCPHCPPAHHEQMASHHGHGDADQAPPCAAFEVQCGDLDDISVDTRNAAQPDDVEQPQIAVIDGLSQRIAAAPRLATRATGPPVPRSAAPPTYLLNCAWLK
jgi:hypothetical protein